MLRNALPRAARTALTAALAALAPAACLAAAPNAARLVPPVLMAAATSARPGTIYNGVPDTGQFLADSVVLARVDDKRFTARTFVYEYFSAFSGDRPRPDSLGRVKFLNSLIDRQVLGVAARKVGYNVGYEGRVEMRDYTQRILANELFRRLVADSVHVTEGDIERAYAQFQVALRIHRILFYDRATAERVRGDLIGGRITWSAAVKKYSRATGDHADGDIGWIMRANLPSVAIADEVYAVKPGQISQVVEDETGYQIMKVVDTQPAHPPALESLRRMIRSQLFSYRMNLMADRVQTLVAAHMGLVADTANIAWASPHFPRPITVERHETGGADINVSGVLPEFSDSDTSRILARWKDGGSISLGRFLIEYGELSPIARPRVDTPELMTIMVINIASEPYKAQMAVERGFDKDSVVVEQVTSHYEKLIVERMYSDSVDVHVQVTPAERRAEYDRHPERYSLQETRYFAAIARSSQAAGDSLAAALRGGASAAAVIAADSVAGIQSGSIQHLAADEHGPLKKIVFEELKAGQVTTVAGTDGKVAVVQLLSIEPARRRTYDEASADADANLRAQKSDELLHAWLARLKKGHHIESRPDLVMLVRLVDPVLTQ